MDREQRLLEFFNELSTVEKDIAIGKVAEVVYKSRMAKLKISESVGSMFSVEELTEKISENVRQLLRVSGEENINSGKEDGR